MKNWGYKLTLLGLIISLLPLSACGPTGSYLYKPASKGPFPTVIVLRGGHSIKSHHLDFAIDLSRKGYVTSVVPYENLQHIADAYEELKTVPEVDPKRIGMVGFSWGARMGLRFALEHPDRKIRGVVNYYSGCTGCWYIGRASYPPSLFLHGDLDVHVTPKELNNFCKMQKKIDKICEVHIYKGVYHAFNNDSPNYDGGIDSVTTADAFKRAVAFLDKYVKGKSK